MGALHSSSLDTTPPLPLALFYRRFWLGSHHAIIDNPPPHFPELSDLFPFTLLFFTLGVTIVRVCLFEPVLTKIAIRVCALTKSSVLDICQPKPNKKIVKEIQNFVTKYAIKKKDRSNTGDKEQDKQRAKQHKQHTQSQRQAKAKAQELLIESIVSKILKDDDHHKGMKEEILSYHQERRENKEYDDNDYDDDNNDNDNDNNNDNARDHDSISLTVRGWFSVVRHDVLRMLKIAKFNEAAWRATFYTALSTLGIIVLIQNNIYPHYLDNMWNDLDTFELPYGLRLYYFLSFGHYFHLLIFQFRDGKRKDFWQMFIHHIVTLLLLFQSYLSNFTKFGACVLIVHDVSDIFLEFAKLANYARLQTLTDSLFAIFALAFIATRCVYFPFWLIWSSFFDAGSYFGHPPAWLLFNLLLGVLLTLHFIWASIITSMVKQALTKGKVDNDARSDDEDERDDENNDEDEEKED